MKKRTLKKLLTLVLLCAFLFALTACSILPLRGEYVHDSGFVEQSFTFLDKDRVRVSAFDIDIEGEYKIEQGTITITYSLFNLHYDWVKSFKRDGKSIFIDGVEFIKAD